MDARAGWVAPATCAVIGDGDCEDGRLPFVSEGPASDPPSGAVTFFDGHQCDKGGKEGSYRVWTWVSGSRGSGRGNLGTWLKFIWAPGSSWVKWGQ